MTLRSWSVLTASCLLVAGAAFAVDSATGKAVLTAAAGVGAAGAGLARVRRRRPAAAGAWWLVCLGVALNSVGTPVEVFCMDVLGLVDWPTPADVLYLALYPFLGAGMLLLVRERAREQGQPSAVEAVILTLGLALLCWVVLIRPVASEPSGSVLAALVSYAYPIGDLVLVAVLVRLLLVARRSASLLLLGAGLGCFLGDDVAWSVFNQVGVEPQGAVAGALSASAVVGYVLCAAAAAHAPAARAPVPASTLDPQSRPAASRWLLSMMTLAMLVAPVVLMVEAALGQVRDAVAISVCSVALSLMVVLRLAQAVRALQQQSSTLRRLTLQDPLTGLANRRELEARLPEVVRQARRRGEPLCVVVVDLDHFKRFNDGYGHAAGDRLLVSAAAAWSGAVREIDLVARTGGEEFVVVMPEAGVSDAAAVVDRLRAVTPLGQTLSAGVAAWRGAESPEELLERADAAMYEAKRAGRDRCVVASGDVEASGEHLLTAPGALT